MHSLSHAAPPPQPQQQQHASTNGRSVRKTSGRITAVHSRFQSADVRIKEDLDFSSLISSPLLLRGLTAAGYQRPSPIQLKAIPLGRLGLDIIAQAKSGTGKTIVFSVIAIEAALGRSSTALTSNLTSAQSGTATAIIDNSSNRAPAKRNNGVNKVPQVIILAPTREIAVQITEVIQALVNEGLQHDVICHAFIGGLPVKEDKKRLLDCSIAVGTPGRVRQLIESGDLKTSQVKLLVLDEADKLMEEGFQEDVTVIAEWAARGGKEGAKTRQKNQVMAFSATYDDQLLAALDKIVKNNPQHIMLCPDQRAPELAGVMQYYKIVRSATSGNRPVAAAAAASLKQARIFESKRQALRCLLEQVPFHQAFVFLNHHGRALELVKYLDRRGWPALFIASTMTQEERLQVMAKARNFELRVLVCTDLIARGIDIERVNLVVSLDVPRDAETYFHRIGRTGRFGTMGLAVGIVDEEEAKTLLDWQQDYGLHLQEIPSEPQEMDVQMGAREERLIGNSCFNTNASTNRAYDFGLLNQQTQSQHYERPLQNEEDLAQFEKLETLRQHAAVNLTDDEDEENGEENDEEEAVEREQGEREEADEIGEQEEHEAELWYSQVDNNYDYPETKAPTEQHYSPWGWCYDYYKHYHGNIAHPYFLPQTPNPFANSYLHHYYGSPAAFHQYPSSFSTPSSSTSFIPPDLPF